MANCLTPVWYFLLRVLDVTYYILCPEIEANAGVKRLPLTFLKLAYPHVPSYAWDYLS